MRKQGGKNVKKGENHSDPIYTNPIKKLYRQSGEIPSGINSDFLRIDDVYEELGDRLHP